MKRRLLGILSGILTMVGIILAVAGTMYESLPRQLRYGSLIGIILFIYGVILIGVYFKCSESEKSISL